MQEQGTTLPLPLKFPFVEFFLFPKKKSPAAAFALAEQEDLHKSYRINRTPQLIHIDSAGLADILNCFISRFLGLFKPFHGFGILDDRL